MRRRRNAPQVRHGRWWAVRLPGTEGRPDGYLRLGRHGDRWVTEVNDATVWPMRSGARNALLRRVHELRELELHHLGYLPTRRATAPVKPWENAQQADHLTNTPTRTEPHDVF